GPADSTLTIQPASNVDVVYNTPAASSGATIEAPMAGNILKILVNIGSPVGAGDVVVIMEAMKMETEVRSKVPGIVSAIHVKEGGAVAGGDVVVTL
ncbi:MAG: biotin/lipoyl-containing protein, partial [Methylococcales bacterium]